jgi:hypothetical protein
MILYYFEVPVFLAEQIAQIVPLCMFIGGAKLYYSSERKTNYLGMSMYISRIKPICTHTYLTG